MQGRETEFVVGRTIRSDRKAGGKESDGHRSGVAVSSTLFPPELTSGSTDTCGAMFMSRLAKLLGIECPEMRMLGVGEEDVARQALSIARYTNPPDSARLRNQRITALSVMQFAPGVPLFARPEALSGDLGVCSSAFSPSPHFFFFCLWAKFYADF